MTSAPASRIPLALSALTLALTVCALAPAAAQEMYPGNDVNVNLSSAGGAQVLLYPDGVHMVALPRLLQPGQKSALAPVHLRMPGKRHRRHHTVHHEAPPPQAVAETEKPAPVTHKVAAPKPPPQTQAASPPPPPATQTASSPPPAAEPSPATTSASGQATAIPFSFGGEGPARSAPARARARRARSRRSLMPGPRSRATTLASAEPPPQTTPMSGDTRLAAIQFKGNSTTLSGGSTARLKNLSQRLMTALTGGADHVELIAYGGNPGDKSSAARRISLKRALAVRESLIINGVPAGRIDVRALGGVTGGGSPNRVDIFVRS